MIVRIRVTASVPVPPEAAYAWWTDYQPTDHDGPAFRAFRWQRREILERNEAGGVVRFRDPGRSLGLDTSYESTLQYAPERSTVIEESQSPMGHFRAEYAFHATGKKTRITWTIEGDLRPRWARALARVPGLAKAIAYADLLGHVKEMEKEIGKGG